MRLWYDAPAERWVEALPVGNGRLGGMVFGSPKRERIGLKVPASSSKRPPMKETSLAKSRLPTAASLSVPQGAAYSSVPKEAASSSVTKRPPAKVKLTSLGKTKAL